MIRQVSSIIHHLMSRITKYHHPLSTFDHVSLHLCQQVNKFCVIKEKNETYPSQGAPGSKQDASTPIVEEKENSFPVFDGDNTIEDQTSIVNESYENSSSWESYEGSSSQEAFEAEKYLDQNNSNVPNDSNMLTADDSNDKYLAIARLDDELENEKWEERTAVITSNDHQVTNWILKCGKL